MSVSRVMKSGGVLDDTRCVTSEDSCTLISVTAMLFSAHGTGSGESVIFFLDRMCVMPINLFIRSIESPSDPTIRQDFHGLQFTGVTILTADWISRRFTLEQSYVVLSVLRTAADQEGTISCIRAHELMQQDLIRDLFRIGIKPQFIDWNSGCFHESDISDLHENKGNAKSWIGFEVETLAILSLVPMFQRYSGSGIAHWVFFSGSLKSDILQTITREPRKAAEFSRFRTELFVRCGMAAVTFDDSMLDIYANVSPNAVRQRLAHVANQLRFTE